MTFCTAAMSYFWIACLRDRRSRGRSGASELVVSVRLRWLFFAAFSGRVLPTWREHFCPGFLTRAVNGGGGGGMRGGGE